MSCVYNDFFTGICVLYDPDIEMPGCTEEGICVCDTNEDPEPQYVCQYFERAPGD